MNLLQQLIFFLIFLSLDAQAQTCKTVTTVANFNITKYASKPWYIQEQAETSYSPSSQNYCVRAKYSVRKSPTFPWGYTVDVNNYAQDSAGNSYGGALCAYQTTAAASKLAVAPCYLPKLLAGPYWVVAYNEREGYALVSGGQPNIRGTNGCKTGEGVNNSGLWIFTRSKARDNDLVKKVRGIAKSKGFDTSVLGTVVHKNCKY